VGGGYPISGRFGCADLGREGRALSIESRAGPAPRFGAGFTEAGGDLVLQARIQGFDAVGVPVPARVIA
jgi:hypothetical protein